MKPLLTLTTFIAKMGNSEHLIFRKCNRGHWHCDEWDQKVFAEL